MMKVVDDTAAPEQYAREAIKYPAGPECPCPSPDAQRPPTIHMYFADACLHIHYRVLPPVLSVVDA